MNLEPFIQSEVSQKNNYHILTSIYGIQKNVTDEPSREWTLDTEWEGEGGMNRESSIDTYILSCLKQIVSRKLLNNTGNIWHSVMIQRDGMRGGKGGSGGDIYRYIYIYIYIKLYLYISIHTDTHIHPHTHNYIYIYIYIYLKLWLTSTAVQQKPTKKL